MDFLDYMWAKLAFFVIAAFVWGIYCGVTGRPLGGAPRDSQAGEAQGRSKGRQ